MRIGGVALILSSIVCLLETGSQKYMFLFEVMMLDNDGASRSTPLYVRHVDNTRPRIRRRLPLTTLSTTTRCVATLINRAASFTSSTVTSLASRIFASASLSRIMLSSCRGVAVTTLPTAAFAPCERMRKYSSRSCAAASSPITGCTFFLAYEMYRYASRPLHNPTVSVFLSMGAGRTTSSGCSVYSETRCVASSRSDSFVGLSRIR